MLLFTKKGGKAIGKWNPDTMPGSNVSLVGNRIAGVLVK